MIENELIKLDDIKSRIFTIRGVQVMLDSDLANLYTVETKVLNQAVKRNLERFPDNFHFQLKHSEYSSLRSQIVTLEYNSPRSLEYSGTKKGRHRKYLPFAFTEQGVAMLSAVLKSATAVKISIQIMEAFVSMRHFIASNEQMFHRMDSLEKWRLETDPKIEKVLTALENKQLQPKQGIFYNGQIFDAHKFVSDLVRSAEKSIILIDNFVDDTVLTLFAKRKSGVTLKILSKNATKQLLLDIKKFNEQFPPAEIQEFDFSHDRFLIIDDSEVYHIGASLKDLGKKWFAFSKMNIETDYILKRIK